MRDLEDELATAVIVGDLAGAEAIVDEFLGAFPTVASDATDLAVKLNARINAFEAFMNRSQAKALEKLNV